MLKRRNVKLAAKEREVSSSSGQVLRSTTRMSTPKFLRVRARRLPKHKHQNVTKLQRMEHERTQTSECIVNDDGMCMRGWYVKCPLISAAFQELLVSWFCGKCAKLKICLQSPLPEKRQISRTQIRPNAAAKRWKQHTKRQKSWHKAGWMYVTCSLGTSLHVGS